MSKSKKQPAVAVPATDKLASRHSLTVLSPTAEDVWKLWTKWGKCTKCSIGTRAICHVFARGSVPASVLFVGEAPGNDENLAGLPFVGRSGRLLDIAINKISNFGTLIGAPNYCVMNTVMCRPADSRAAANRQPSDLEQHNCAPGRRELIQMVKPTHTVLLGKVAAQWWLAEVACIAPIPMCKTIQVWHPAYVLRNGAEHSVVFEEWVQKMATFLKGVPLAK